MDEVVELSYDIRYQLSTINQERGFTRRTTENCLTSARLTSSRSTCNFSHEGEGL